MLKFTRLLILFAISQIHLGLYAQSFVEVGTGNDETNLPCYTSWRYSYSSSIYLKEELGGPKTITAIAFNNSFVDLVAQGNDYDLINQKVWFKMVPETQDTWDNNMSYEDPENNGYTLVWQGTIHYGELGWYKIDLTTPFDYDGTGNLVMHWENRSGVEKYNFKFASTHSGLKQVKILGADNAVPTGSGYEYYPNGTKVNVRFYYNSANEPANPELISPSNASIKVDLGASLNFTLGDNTESYDLYLGNDINSMIKVVDNQTVPGAGTYSYQPSQLLEPKTVYYWKVVARNSQTTKESNVYSFTTQGIINTFPYIQDFESYWVSYIDPSNPDTLSSVINTNYPDSTDWEWDNYWNCLKRSVNNFKGLFSAYVNTYSQGTYSLVTPRVNLPSNMRISFWWRNYYTISDKTAGNDTTYFQISVDGKNTWITLLKLCGPANMPDYENAIVDLSDYSGNNVYFRWMYRSYNSNAEPFLIDDIKIENIPTSAFITLNEQNLDFGTLVPNGKRKRKIIIYNTGTTDLVINGITTDGPFICDFNKTIAPNQKDTATVYFAPTEVGVFNGTFSFNVNGAQGNATVNCTAEAIEPLSQFFQNFDAVKAIPEGWVANQSSFAGSIVSNISVINTSSEVYSSPNAIKMNRVNSDDTLDAVILSTPGVTNYTQNILSFYARKGSNDYNLEIIVGVMSDPSDTSTFVAKKTFALTDNYQQYTVQFKANTTEPYIGFKFGAWTPTSPFPYPTLRLDDVSWEPNTTTPPQPAIIGYPNNEEDSVDIMNGLKLTWSAGSSNTNGYRLYVGTTPACNELINGDSLTQMQNSYSIDANELSFNTTYYWKVVPFNEYGDCTEPNVWSFITMPDPTITNYPMVETFDKTLNITGQFDKPLGWTIEDTNNDRATWDIVNYPPAIQGFTRNDSKGAIHVPFHIINPKNDWLFTPPLSVKTGKTYTIDFYIHTMLDYTTGLVYNEKISVWIGNDRVSTAMTDSLAYDNIDDATTWKNVQASYTPTKDTILYFGLHAISEPNQYVLIVDDVTITETSPQSVPTEKASKDLHVYPNPVSQQLYFRIAELNDREDVKISVWDMTGRKLYEIQTSEKTINVSSLSNGFYILKIETGHKIYTQTFIVKQ